MCRAHKQRSWREEPEITEENGMKQLAQRARGPCSEADMVLASSLGQIAGRGYTAHGGTKKLPTNFERKQKTNPSSCISTLLCCQ